MYSGTTTTGTYTLNASGNFGVYFQPIPQVPRHHGGPALSSTCTDLVPDPVVVHDVNLYYRLLGFSWPFKGITRKMLRQAYQERGGPNDIYLTNALKMLLDDDIRQIYRRRPFGHPLVDVFVFERAKAKAAKLASEIRARGGKARNSDFLQAWGFPVPDDPDFDDEPFVVDADAPDGGSETTDSFEPVNDPEEPFGDSVQDPSVVAEGDDTVLNTWGWGYFTWRSNCHDQDRLEVWQRELLRAARRHDLRVLLGVGFTGMTPREWEIGSLGEGAYVIFLNESLEPSPQLAAEALCYLNQMINEA
jgi:hypothetical protein